MVRKNKSLQRKTTSSQRSSQPKFNLNAKNTKLLLYLIVAGILLFFSYSFFTSTGESISAKLSDAFTKTKNLLFFNVENDTSNQGISLNTLTLDKIEQGYPKIDATGEIETYSGFHLSYNEQHEQANWVAYILTKEMVRNDKAERNNNFRPDENIQTGSATLADYRGTGYDRGHLAPAADMHWSAESMDESFLMSNMSPQEQEFNRGIWKMLEEKVRDFAVENERIYVVTGPILKDITKKIGKNSVSVPKYYYKVILDISTPSFKGIAFLMENKESSKSLASFAMSIDELEKFSGIDFFQGVKDSAIEKIEDDFDIKAWSLN